MFSERFVFFGFSFDTTAQQWLDGFSLNLHQQRRLCSVFVNGGTPIKIGPPPNFWGPKRSVFGLKIQTPPCAVWN